MTDPTPEEIAKLQQFPGFAGREAHRPGPMRDKALEAMREAGSQHQHPTIPEVRFGVNLGPAPDARYKELMARTSMEPCQHCEPAGRIFHEKGVVCPNAPVPSAPVAGDALQEVADDLDGGDPGIAPNADMRPCPDEFSRAIKGKMFEKDTASAEGAVTHPHAIAEAFLDEMGFKPTRVGITASDSKLFQFLRGRVEAALDVYPDGTAVVMAQRKAEHDDLYEMNIHKDQAHIAKILAGYGVPWGDEEYQSDSFYSHMEAEIATLEREARRLREVAGDLAAVVRMGEFGLASERARDAALAKYVALSGGKEGTP